MDVNIRYDLAWLINIVSSGKRPKYVYFWGHRSKAGGEITKACFSQWWPSPFVVDDNRYFSAEHWMMAEKARLFDNEDIRQKILNVSKPGEAKAFGRQVRNFDQDIWNAAKLDIVVQGSIHKFSQNPGLADFLLGTGKRVLVEASPVDPIWGIGVAIDDERAANPRLWKGENLLGFALMIARDKLQAA